MQVESTRPDASLLQGIPFLANVDHEELESLVEASVVRSYMPGQPVVSQGDFGHSMFILVNGRVSISVASDEGPKVLGQLGVPGEFFGEFALLGRGQRSATVTSDMPTTLLEIEKRRFDLLARRNQEALAKLETTYHQRAISTYMNLHPFLKMLPAELITPLIQNATMRKFNRNDVVCRVGDLADKVMLIKDGVLKATRPGSGGGVSILAYFNTHDLAGVGDGPQRGYDLIALGQAEIIFIDRHLIDGLEQKAPDVHARFGKSNMSNPMANLGGAGGNQNTVMGFAAAFLQEGAEAESLLIINLDRCVRCGNCVRACHARHEYTRLARRGPIFKRRKSVESKKHQHLLVPSSCRHCRDPECMIGCPTGAIQRFPDGDVGINDNCIGCDNCARKCPYGNISMRPLPESEQKDGVVKKAIKCNLCRGYTYSNCVHECPRGAILRVDPLGYFDELSVVMSQEQQDNLRMKKAADKSKHQSKQTVKPRSTIFIFLSFLLGILGAGGIMAAFMMAPEPVKGGTPTGLILGGVGTFCILTAMFYGARKKMRKRNIGPLEWWTQFHLIIGLLGFLAALAHAGFQITGILTFLLLLVFGLEVLTGVLGQFLYMTVPTRLTRIERSGQSKLIEDLIGEELELQESILELRKSLPDDYKKILDGPIGKHALKRSKRMGKDYDSEKFTVETLGMIDFNQVPAPLRPSLERSLKDLCRLGDVKAQLRLHRMLRRWLVAHLGFTAMLAVFLFAHIAIMVLLVL